MKENSGKSTQEVLLRQERKLQKAANPVKPLLLPLLLLFFVVLDALTIFELMDQMFYQSRWLSVLITVGIAIVLEGIPYLASQYFMRDKKTIVDKVTLAALGTVFLLIFITLFVLRWNARALTFSSNESQLAVITSIQTVEQVDSIHGTSAAENVMTVLLGITPLATSVLAFFLSCIYKTSDKLKDKKKINAIELEERLKVLSIKQNEIKNELKRDLVSYNEDLYHVAVEQVNDYEKMLKVIVRQKLAVYLGTAQAVTNLLEKNREEEL